MLPGASEWKPGGWVGIGTRGGSVEKCSVRLGCRDVLPGHVPGGVHGSCHACSRCYGRRESVHGRPCRAALSLIRSFTHPSRFRMLTAATTNLLFCYQCKQMAVWANRVGATRWLLEPELPAPVTGSSLCGTITTYQGSVSTCSPRATSKWRSAAQCLVSWTSSRLRFWLRKRRTRGVPFRWPRTFLLYAVDGHLFGEPCPVFPASEMLFAHHGRREQDHRNGKRRARPRSLRARLRQWPTSWAEIISVTE